MFDFGPNDAITYQIPRTSVYEDTLDSNSVPIFVSNWEYSLPYIWDTLPVVELSSDRDYFYISPVMEEGEELDMFISVVRRCPMDSYEWFFDTCLDSCPENTE